MLVGVIMVLGFTFLYFMGFVMSFDAPGPKGMMRRIGRDGYDSAAHAAGVASSAATSRTALMPLPL